MAEMSPEVEAAMIPVLAKRFGAVEADGRGRKMSPLGLARLVCAISSDCGGKEDCETCVLGGVGCCLFDRTGGSDWGPGQTFRPAA